MVQMSHDIQICIVPDGMISSVVCTRLYDLKIEAHYLVSVKGDIITVPWLKESHKIIALLNKIYYLFQAFAL